MATLPRLLSGVADPESDTDAAGLGAALSQLGADFGGGNGGLVHTVADRRDDPSDDDLLAELRALRARRRQDQQAQPPSEEPVGESQLARDLEASGFIDHLGRQFAERRMEDDRRALEQSQGWSVDSVARSVSNFFGGNRPNWMSSSSREELLGHADVARQRFEANLPDAFRLQMSPEGQQAVAQAELETRQQAAPNWRGVANRYPGSADMFRLPHMQAMYPPGEAGITTRYGNVSQPELAHTIVGGLVGAEATRQEQALARAQAVMQGRLPLPQIGQWRAAVLSGQRSIADMFTSMPLQTAGIMLGYGLGAYEALQGPPAYDPYGSSPDIRERPAPGQPYDPYGSSPDVAERGPQPVFRFHDNRLYQFGRQVQESVEQAFPNDPARQFEFAQALAQGLGSSMAFMGQGAIASILGAGQRGQLAVIALSGMAAQTPDEFRRVTEALNRGDATERDRILVTLSNALLLGPSEALPFSGTLNAGARGVRARFGRGVGQGVEETIQETLQQSGQNLTRLGTYLPNQDPYEGVLQAQLVAFIAGFGPGFVMSGEHGASQPEMAAANAISSNGWAMFRRGERP